MPPVWYDGYLTIVNPDNKCGGTLEIIKFHKLKIITPQKVGKVLVVISEGFRWVAIKNAKACSISNLYTPTLKYSRPVQHPPSKTQTLIDQMMLTYSLKLTNVVQNRRSIDWKTQKIVHIVNTVDELAKYTKIAFLPALSIFNDTDQEWITRFIQLVFLPEKKPALR